MTPNRVAKMAATIQERIDALPPERAASLDESMAIDASEHFRFQQMQAEAHASGTLTADEALTVYAALGDPVGSDANGGWAAGTTTAAKCTVTKLMAELLGRKLGVR